jgi:hypothetical protein
MFGSGDGVEPTDPDDAGKHVAKLAPQYLQLPVRNSFGILDLINGHAGIGEVHHLVVRVLLLRKGVREFPGIGERLCPRGKPILL